MSTCLQELTDMFLLQGLDARPQSSSVPQLPNPMTILTDVPSIVSQMLSGIAEERWDQTNFLPTWPVPGFKDVPT
eukprot:5789753-Amphidinium_carterae.1